MRRGTSDILVPSIASIVMRPKHIIVVLFCLPSSRDFPAILGRYRAFWSSYKVGSTDDNTQNVRLL